MAISAFHKRHGSPGGYVPSESGLTDQDIRALYFGLGDQGDPEPHRRALAADYVEQWSQIALDEGKGLPNDAGERFTIDGWEASVAKADALAKYLALTADELEAANVRLHEQYPTL